MQQSGSKKTIRKWLWIAGFVTVCIAALLILLNSTSPGTAFPLSVQYNGKLYMEDAYYLLELPDGAKHLGPTHFAANNVQLFEQDMDCNLRRSGCVFTDPDDETILYFEDTAWNPVRYRRLKLVED